MLLDVHPMSMACSFKFCERDLVAARAAPQHRRVKRALGRLPYVPGEKDQTADCFECGTRHSAQLLSTRTRIEDGTLITLIQ
jgi:hypothetical protein